MEKEIIKKHVTLSEYKKILELLGREPNIVELGIFSAMWSEHCSYKSSKVHLKKLPTRAPWVIQGPGENAGVVEIDPDEKICAVFKIESHNHPSFIEPFHGAATGVGGILRDIFTMGARPIVCMDSLRFGEPEDPKMQFIVKGVIAGISHYGNCVGVPTAGGEVYFDRCYQTNPLVNVFALGIARKEKIFYAKAQGIGNPIIYVGARTGRDGIHGATMASEEFSSEEETEKKINVQVGDPFTEKLLIEACLEAMKESRIVSIQDMGAAGLTSSSVEMASKGKVGVELHLDNIPLREKNMTPYEIMLSESQERMLIVAERGREEETIRIFKKWGLEACIIGKIIGERNLKVIWKGKLVADIPIKLLVDESPVYIRPSRKPEYLKKTEVPEVIRSKDHPETTTLKLLSSPTISSKDWIYSQYDHMVQINTITLPGSDACVLRIKNSRKGIAISSDGNSRFCYLDPYEGAKLAVAESARNIACSGAVPRAITNCLNFASPEDPEIMWQFEKCIEGIAEACKILSTPVVSGNVSFYNETVTNSGKRSIYPTPIIVCVGVIEDINKVCTAEFKEDKDVIILLGENRGNISGSEYQKLYAKNYSGKQTINLEFEKKLQKAVVEAINKGLIKSCHDVSEGGLCICLFESAFKNNLGFTIEFEDDIETNLLLFGEEPSKIVVTTKEASVKSLLKLMEGNSIPAKLIGEVTASPYGIIRHKGKTVINIPVEKARKAYTSTLSKKATAL